MMDISGFYRDKNFTGKEFKKICSTIFHSLVRDEKFLNHFIEMTQNKNLKLEHLSEYTFLNSIVFNWNDIKIDGDFDKHNADQRAAFATQVINSLQEGINHQFQTSSKEEIKKEYDADQIKKATRNQKATLKYITDINENVKTYIDSLFLDISKKDADKFSKILGEDGKPKFDKDKIFHKNRPFTEEEEKEFKAKILELAALEDKSKIATLKRKIDTFTENRRIYTHNNNQQTSPKKTAAARKQGLTTLKELIFSIPKTQAVFYDQQILKDAVNDFIKDRYSNYNHFYVVHKDELRETDLTKLVKAGKATEEELEKGLQDRKGTNFSGDHVHLFISGFDHEGNQNLIETEKKRITDFAKNQGIDIDFTKPKLTKLESKIYGQMKQQEFREHFNQYLEKAGIKIVKLLERHPDFDLKEYNKALNQANKGLLNLNNGVNDYLRGVKEKREREEAIKKLDMDIEELQIIENRLEDKIEDLEGKEAFLDIEVGFYREERIKAINEELRTKKEGIETKLNNYEKRKREEIETKLKNEFEEKTKAISNLDTKIADKENTLNTHNSNIEIKEKELQELNDKIFIANQAATTIISNDVIEYFEEQHKKITNDIEVSMKNLFSSNPFKSKELEKAQVKTKELQATVFHMMKNFDGTPQTIQLEEKDIFGKHKTRKETEKEIDERRKQCIKDSNISDIYSDIKITLNEQQEITETLKEEKKKEYKFNMFNLRDSLYNALFNEELNETKKKLKEEQDKNKELNKQNTDLNNEVSRLNNLINSLNNTINELKTSLKTITSAFNNAIKAVIDTGHISDIKWSLNRKLDHDTLKEIKKIEDPEVAKEVEINQAKSKNHDWNPPKYD